ncbi:hypothetical protein D2E26_0953 [Bifidobacterium dolichotidis]|uniref:Uncharacterized protein n=1 Tax=Bifidobacterium dolichotidis TaxID=2306976 RepID=A0A430FPY5_9BIFI|nr:hypothetical protein [Bifidobacterium dolichotidis]RSX54899.1 hypothetical protein D2E26_0953 [Bifidobacterium dolichotidis]
MMKTLAQGVTRFNTVFGMLLRFFRRTLLQYGVLRTKAVRWALVGLAAVWLSFACVIVFVFTKPIDAQKDMWPFMVDMSWVSSIPWVIGAFLAVKLLFSKADGALRVVSHLPVTSIMRKLAIKACEACVVLCVILVSALAVVTSVIAHDGFPAVGLVATHIALPVLVLYAALCLAWDLVARFMHIIGLGKFSGLVGLCATSALLVQYAVSMMQLSLDVQKHWVQNDGNVLWITVVGDLTQKYGALPIAAASIGVIIGLVALDMVVAPPQYCGQADYLPLRLPSVGHSDIAMFASYVVRSKDTFLETLLSLACAILLCLHKDASWALYPVCMVTFTGLSQFAEGIPRVWSVHRQSAVHTYICLIVSQIIVYTLIWAAIALIILPWGTLGTMDYIYSYLGVAAGTVLCTTLGILFPMTKNNPLAAIIGFASLALIGILLVCGIGILNLKGTWLVVAGIAIFIAMIFYSVFGIQTHQRSVRHGSC